MWIAASHRRKKKAIHSKWTNTPISGSKEGRCRVTSGHRHLWQSLTSGWGRVWLSRLGVVQVIDVLMRVSRCCVTNYARGFWVRLLLCPWVGSRTTAQLLDGLLVPFTNDIRGVTITYALQRCETMWTIIYFWRLLKWHKAISLMPVHNNTYSKFPYICGFADSSRFTKGS